MARPCWCPGLLLPSLLQVHSLLRFLAGWSCAVAFLPCCSCSCMCSAFAFSSFFLCTGPKQPNTTLWPPNTVPLAGPAAARCSARVRGPLPPANPETVQAPPGPRRATQKNLPGESTGGGNISSPGKQTEAHRLPWHSGTCRNTWQQISDAHFSPSR